MWATLLPTPNPAPQQKGKVCKNLRHQDRKSPFRILSSKETQPCGRCSLYMAAHNCPEGSIRVWQGCRSASVLAWAKMRAQLGLSSRHSNDVMSLISLPQSHNARRQSLPPRLRERRTLYEESSLIAKAPSCPLLASLSHRCSPPRHGQEERQPLRKRSAEHTTPAYLKLNLKLRSPKSCCGPLAFNCHHDSRCILEGPREGASLQKLKALVGR